MRVIGPADWRETISGKKGTGAQRAGVGPGSPGSPAAAWSLALLFLLLPVAAPAQGPAEGGFSIPDSLRTRAEARLEQHVDAAELRAWRDTCATAARDAFDFLFAWLPPSDLSAWRWEQIRADIELALETRGNSPWKGEISDGLFLTYVLPHRVAQEPIQPWRTVIHEQLRDRVQELSLREAVLETNRFCREHATFRPSSSRDQGPLTTMEKGIGRCEEEMIFFVSAARSIGIPARPCYTPAWMAGDNNHAWVEAWTGDGWHYLGACEPAPDVDMAWFTGPARRAGLVLSVAYGEGGAPGETVYNTRDGATLINSTAVYTTPGRVLIEWADLKETPEAAKGTEAARAAGAASSPRDTLWVTAHVFNWGSLSPLGRFRAADGITLGPGDYVLSCQVEDTPMAAKATVRPGQTTAIRFDPAQPESLRLGWLESPFWLRIPDPEAGKAEPAAGEAGDESGRPQAAEGSEEADRDEKPEPKVDPLIQKTHEANLARRDLERCRQGIIPAMVVAALAEREQEDLGSLLEHLESAGPRAPRWAEMLGEIEESLFPRARDLVLAMDEKDFYEADPQEARDAVTEAHSVRAWRSRWESPVPDSIWAEFVLSPRIDRQPGDPALWSVLPLLTLQDSTAVPVEGMLEAADRIPAPAQFVHAFFAGRVVQEEDLRLGYINRPSEAWLSKALTTASARAALVGLMRRNGIPSRVDAERRWVEAWVDGEWIPADPFDPGSWDRKEGTVAEAYAEPARLLVDFLDRSAPMRQVEGWKHFRLARWTDGRFEPLWIDYPVSEGRLEMDLQPGDWWLFGGQRDKTGSPWINARRLQPVSGETLHLEIDLGIPPAELAQEALASRQIPVEAVQEIWSALGRKQPVLVFAWAPDSEPSLRTAEALLSGWAAVGEAGVPVVSTLVWEGSGPRPQDLIPGSAARWTVTEEQMRAWLGVDRREELPVTAWIDDEGTTLLYLEGMQLAVVDFLRRTAEIAERP